MRPCEEHRVQHWRVPFLGLQAIPPELTDFEIRYFFSYTAKERAAIFSRKWLQVLRIGLTSYSI